MPPPPNDDDEKHHRQFEQFEREAMVMSEEFRAKAALILHEEAHE